MTCSQLLAEISANKTHRMMLAKVKTLGGAEAVESLRHLVQLGIVYVVWEPDRQDYAAYITTRYRKSMVRRIEIAA